jgi:Zn-dependent protease
MDKWRIFTLSNIPVYVSHAWLWFAGTIGVLTFGLTLYSKGFSTAFHDTALVLLTVASAYVIVISHEFGHALTSQYFNYKVSDITIWPMAGLASMADNFDGNPWHHFCITIAGPAVNFVFCWLLLPFVLLFPGNFYVDFLLTVNLMMLLFNLAPVYPMDGGRLLFVFIDLLNPTLDQRIVHYRTVVASAVLALLIAPFITAYHSATPAVLICLMGLFGGPIELSARLESASDDRLRMRKLKHYWDWAKQLTGNKDEQRAYVAGVILWNDLLDRLLDLLQEKGYDWDESYNIGMAFREFVQEIPEEDRLLLNSRFNTEDVKEVLWEVLEPIIERLYSNDSSSS